MMDEEADDRHMGAYVYCRSHLRPHATGWCEVFLENKVPLDAQTIEDAYEECCAKGYRLFEDVK